MPIPKPFWAPVPYTLPIQAPPWVWKMCPRANIQTHNSPTKNRILFLGSLCQNANNISPITQLETQKSMLTLSFPSFPHIRFIPFYFHICITALSPSIPHITQLSSSIPIKSILHSLSVFSSSLHTIAKQDYQNVNLVFPPTHTPLNKTLWYLPLLLESNLKSLMWSIRPCRVWLLHIFWPYRSSLPSYSHPGSFQFLMYAMLPPTHPHRPFSSRNTLHPFPPSPT